MESPYIMTDTEDTLYIAALELERLRRIGSAIKLLNKPGCTLTHTEGFCGMADVTQPGDTQKRRKVSEECYFVIIGRYPTDKNRG